MGLWVAVAIMLFVGGMGIGVAHRLASLPADDDSWLGNVRDGWLNMYDNMSGEAAGAGIEYFVYHPDVSRDTVRAYADGEPGVESLLDTVYDSASVFVVAKENRTLLSQIESQPWVDFAIRGELLFFCH